jgi:pseudouridine kinase
MDQTIFSYADGPVLVIGAAGLDIVGKLRSDLHFETSNPARIRASFGGVARNVAENLARLGQEVILLAAVGDDQTGSQLIQHAAESGVNVQAVLRSAEKPTGTYLGVLNARGELQLALDDMRAVSAITPTCLREHAELFKEASMLFLDANLPKDSLRTAMSLANRWHLPVVADPTSVALAARLRPYLRRLHVITPNSAEAGILCDRTIDAARRGPALDAARHLVSLGVDIAIIGLAEHGVCYATSETAGRIPAIRTEIVDPTGAGDALTAAVIFALLNEIPIDDAVRLGVSAASLTLRHPGAVLPDLSLQKLYDQLVI